VIVALLDAGPLIALFDNTDQHHERFRQLLTRPELPMRLHTTWPCITEATHLLGARERLGLLRWIGAGGVQVFPFDTEDLFDMADWMTRYTEERAEMDLADATLYWVAHETGVARILTLDVRDFSRYRLPDGRSFEIL
jgi:predicted nucleic acid-binding protein